MSSSPIAMPEWTQTAKRLDADPLSGFVPEAFVASDTFDIAAPAAIVWEILTDFANYNDWNPFCVRAEAKLEMGSPVVMKLVTPIAPGVLVPNCEYICAIEKERLISWELPFHEAWPYPARRDQIIEPSGPESCRYVSTDAFLGRHGIHVMNFCGGWVKQAFDNTGRALKARAESMHAQRRAR